MAVNKKETGRGCPEKGRRPVFPVFNRLCGYPDLSYLMENVDIENIVGITFIFFIGAVGIYVFLLEASERYQEKRE